MPDTRSLVMHKIMQGGQPCEFCPKPATWTAYRGGRRAKGVHFGCDEHKDDTFRAASKEG